MLQKSRAYWLSLILTALVAVGIWELIPLQTFGPWRNTAAFAVVIVCMLPMALRSTFRGLSFGSILLRVVGALALAATLDYIAIRGGERQRLWITMGIWVVGLSVLFFRRADETPAANR